MKQRRPAKGAESAAPAAPAEEPPQPAGELHVAVESGGSPRLEGADGKPAGGAPGADPEGVAPAAADPLAAEKWTGEEAQLFLSMIWNVGCFAYGIEWMAKPQEFAAWRDDAGQLLDVVLPKSIAGPAATAVALTKVAGGIGMMVVARQELIRKGPTFLARKRVTAPAAPGGEAPAEPLVKAPPAPAEGADNAKPKEPQPGGFRFKKDDAAIMGENGRPPDGVEELSSLGMA